MIPQSQPKQPKNSSKANLTISAIVHGVIIIALIYFAAREGYLGKKIQTITVTKVEEKKKEPEKPKEEPKPEPPKVEQPKLETPKVETAKVAPPTVAPPVVAPAAADVPSFDFAGGKTVLSESDPVQLYKGYIEYTLRSKWNRPEDLADDSYVAEVKVNVDPQGKLSQSQWLKGSGDAKWDQTVKDVFKTVSQIDRRPPTNFPDHVTIRFDVQEETEPVLQ
ncbi:MAG TPA: TonB C-terminal domain-containing protein [Verrucomicrobiae bacterium]|nr:TonB C-terminal domain-containing protein [Verrucomicrobiae bacterium]